MGERGWGGQESERVREGPMFEEGVLQPRSVSQVGRFSLAFARSQRTALHRCAETGFLEVCEVLISHHATLDIQDKVRCGYVWGSGALFPTLRGRQTGRQTDRGGGGVGGDRQSAGGG